MSSDLAGRRPVDTRALAAGEISSGSPVLLGPNRQLDFPREAIVQDDG